MVITDLDGTLAGPGGFFSGETLAVLARLGEDGVCRVVATGRTLHGASRALGERFPIDYLIFSSGAGILDWKTRAVLNTFHLQRPEIMRTIEVLQWRRADYMLHHPIPDTHHFYYLATGEKNPDFERRCERYGELAVPLPDSLPLQQATQFVAIARPSQEASLQKHLEMDLPELKIIRATSPLDGKSLWLEIFPPQVSKARAAHWLAEREGVDPKAVLGVGNDYNDLDLLRWAGTAFVVGNSPEELQREFSTVASNDAGGFIAAVSKWHLGK
jgi:HAD superfamily hydrolase (TIGR01484 family)